MRKFWVLALFLTAVTRIFAQLPSGSIAPDFTAKDLNGETWHLYDLLDQGKIVILEISATWCAPCWAYHNGHAMHQFYEQHGPDGDDRARVLFIEGDPKTNINCLYGQSGCNDYSPGNWVTGTPFPIINDDSIAKAYKIEYFPTIFVVCPNRKIYEMGQWNAADLWEQAVTCPVAYGTTNAGLFDFSTGTAFQEICGSLPVNPSFSLINLGSEALTQATLALSWNNTPLQTVEWNGHLDLYETAAIAFDELALTDSGTLTTTLVKVNYAPTDDDPANNMRESGFDVAKNFNSLKVLLRIRTDLYGAETYWELRDDVGNVLESGGNKAVGPNGGGMYTGIAGGPGAYNNNVTIRDTLNLPEPGCYSIHFVDYYGDGMCCNYGNGYYRLYNLEDPTLPVISGGEFRAYEDRAFSAGLVSATGEPEQPAAPSLLLYPNPAGDFIGVNFTLPDQANISLSVTNALGQVVYRELPVFMPAGGHQKEINISRLPEGLYWMRLQANDLAVTRKLVVQRW